MKKIMITGCKGMLASDFIIELGTTYDLICIDKKNMDITDSKEIEKKIYETKPDIVLNFAAYTDVENAEDIGMKKNYETNTLGVYNLAKSCNKEKIDLITISTDYVFDGSKNEGYNENDTQQPINNYGMAKYLGEKLAKQENPNTIIIRTSRLYGGGLTFKNFVNTIIKLSGERKELKIINDQRGNPTYTKDLVHSIEHIINQTEKYKGKIVHLSNETPGNGISWYDFAKEICKIKKIDITITPCTSEEFVTKAKRPKYSKLLNNSDIILRNRQEGLQEYISKI